MVQSEYFPQLPPMIDFVYAAIRCGPADGRALGIFRSIFMTNLRVMIVEEDSRIAGLWAELMDSLGHEVCAIAADPDAAAIAARQQRPDAVIVHGCLQTFASGLEAGDFEVDLVAALRKAFGASSRRRAALSVGAGAPHPGFAAQSLM
jgi:hypothetical protein